VSTTNLLTYLYLDSLDNLDSFYESTKIYCFGKGVLIMPICPSCPRFEKPLGHNGLSRTGGVHVLPKTDALLDTRPRFFELPIEKSRVGFLVFELIRKSRVPSSK
jgi:hypothetical protein